MHENRIPSLKSNGSPLAHRMCADLTSALSVTDHHHAFPCSIRLVKRVPKTRVGRCPSIHGHGRCITHRAKSACQWSMLPAITPSSAQAKQAVSPLWLPRVARAQVVCAGELTNVHSTLFESPSPVHERQAFNGSNNLPIGSALGLRQRSAQGDSIPSSERRIFKCLPAVPQPMD